LSQAYLETDDFKADPATFREIKHRGNIKAALCDGVLVTEVIAQRIAGKKEIDVELKFVDAAPARTQEQVAAPAATPIERVMTSISMPQRASKEKSEPAPQRPYLVRVIAGSVEEDEFPLNLNGTTTIGRKFCDIVFPDDNYLSERHASIIHGPDGFSLRDDGSSTGVFVKAVEGKSIEVSAGDLLRLGRQFLVFNNDNGSFGFTHYDQTGKELKRHILSDKTIVLGREAPDITLDPKDMTLSRRHLSISVRDGKMIIKDLKSVNGTYLKVRSAVMLEDGDQFRVGQQAFKLSFQKQQAPTKVHVTTKLSMPPRSAPAPLPSPPAPAVVATGMNVVIKNVGKSLPFASGQTLCEIAEKNGVKIVAECHAGICGSDPVKILTGKENLNPMGAEEKGTLEDICGVSPDECRLACMARPKGAVEIEIL
jgi:pSer/pThr/pTyr-binding forkhead associated (FHA) protein/ferredoxin